MLGVAMYTTIKTCKELGKNKTEIARITGHDWKTVDKVIKLIEDGKERPERKEKTSIVDPFKEKVAEMIENGLSGVRIHEELVREGFVGSYSQLRSIYENARGRRIYL